MCFLRLAVRLYHQQEQKVALSPKGMVESTPPLQTVCETQSTEDSYSFATSTGIDEEYSHRPLSFSPSRHTTSIFYSPSASIYPLNIRYLRSTHIFCSNVLSVRIHEGGKYPRHPTNAASSAYCHHSSRLPTSILSTGQRDDRVSSTEITAFGLLDANRSGFEKLLCSFFD